MELLAQVSSSIFDYGYIMPFRVDVMEYERNWGSRLDERVYFNDRGAAQDYVDVFNSTNDSTIVPDWYMTANDPFYVPMIPVGEEARDD